MLCTERTLVKKEGTYLLAEPLRCRCWSCDYCAPNRKRQLVAQALAGSPDTLLTLTVNPAVGLSPADRAVKLAHAWRALRKRAMKHYGYPRLPFLAVFERTKRGEPHLHILLRVKWLDQRWLSEQMTLLVEAPIVDIRRVHRVRSVARYVAKYIAKDPHRFEGVKRYWASRDYSLDPETKEERRRRLGGESEVVKQGFWDYLASMSSRGWMVSREGEAATLWAPPWAKTRGPP